MSLTTSARNFDRVLPLLTRSLQNLNVNKLVPPPRGGFATKAFPDVLSPNATMEKVSRSVPADFLKAIGRSMDTKLPSADSWEAFWQMDGHALKKAGISVKDRRYLLWCMEKYRQGLSVKDFAHEPKPKKTIRGWGPVIQNGKRNRSGRH